MVVACATLLTAQQEFSGGLRAPFGDAGWSVAAVADFDGNLTSDILWRHADGRAAVAVMSGGTVTALAVTPPFNEPGWRITGARDFDGDGKADILWRQATNGRSVAWLMDGVTVAAQVPIDTADAGWRAARV